MTAPRRALCALSLQGFTAGQLAMLRELERDHDELVVAVTDAEQAFTREHPRSAGERIARVAPLLRAELGRPFYLLPVKRDGLSPAQYTARIGLYCPPFETFASADDDELRLAARVLRCATRLFDGEPMHAVADLPIDPPPPERRRGLFITRAQPCTVAHRAFVRQIAREQDEVVVLVSKGNLSHRLDDPATAGERVEMVRPLLEAEAPGRHHLCAAPYLDDDGRNFAELELLLPAFQAVYTSSPSTAAMAESAGYPVIALDGEVAGSATLARERLAAGEPVDDLVPPEVLAVLQRSAVPARLRRLAEPERRP